MGIAYYPTYDIFKMFGLLIEIEIILLYFDCSIYIFAVQFINFNNDDVEASIDKIE